MTWTLRIPYRSWSDSLAEVVDAAAELDPEDRATVRGLVLELLGSSIEVATAGDVLDHVESLAPDARRVLLTSARERGGLPSPDAVDARRVVEARTSSVASRPRRDEAGRAVQACAVCRKLPHTATGTVEPRVERRWHCPDHAHLAGERDMEPYRGIARYTPGGCLEIVDPIAEELEREREVNRAQR